MKRIFSVVLSFAGLALLITACGGGTPPPGGGGGGPDVIIHDDVQVLDEQGREDLQQFDLDLDTGEGMLRFKPGSAAAAALEAGTILASEPVSGVAPYGFLQRVVSKRDVGGDIVVETQQANLLDAIGQADIKLEQPLKPSDVVSARTNYEGMSLSYASEGLTPQASVGFDFNVNFDKVLIDGDGDHSTTDDQLIVDGSFRFNAVASAGIDICFCGEVDWAPDWAPQLQKMYGKARLDESVEVNLNGELAVGFDERFEVARFNFGAFTVFAGPVPVVFVVDMVISIGANGQFEAQLAVSATQSTGVQVGLEYTHDHGWRDLNEFDFGFDFPTPQITAAASARAFLRPQLNVMIYGLAGPYLYAEPYVKADAELYRSPFWRFTGGMDVGIGFLVDLPLVGKLAEYETTLVGFKTTLQESTNQAPKLEVLGPPDGQTRTEGDYIGFKVSASDREQEKLTFSVTDGAGVTVLAARPLGPDEETISYGPLCIGGYTFNLKVRDDAGATDQATISTTVENYVPTVSVSGELYDSTSVYSGGPLFGLASAFDRTCATSDNGADQDLIQWFIDDNEIATGSDLTHFLPAGDFLPGSTIKIAAEYNDGIVTVRSPNVTVQIEAVPADQMGKPQAVILDPYDGKFTSCFTDGKQDVRGKGYVLGGGMLDGSALTWEVDSGGGFQYAGSGEALTVNYELGVLDSHNVMTIALRLTATNGSDSSSVTSHFQAALCG